MRTDRRVLVAMALSLVGQGASAATATVATPDSAPVAGSPSWAGSGPGQPFGFSAPTVTQSGVTYAPSDPTVAASPGAATASLADLPAWDARSPDPAPARDDLLSTIGLRRFGPLPEPAIWALLIAGFAIIGGSIRGFVVVNRRLNRLRGDDESEDG